MCILLTAVLYYITTVLIEVYLLCSTESVSLRDIGKRTSRAEISSPSSLHLRAVKKSPYWVCLISFFVPLLNHFMAEIAFVIICITPLPPHTQIQSQLCGHMTYTTQYRKYAMMECYIVGGERPAIIRKTPKTNRVNYCTGCLKSLLFILHN